MLLAFAFASVQCRAPQATLKSRREGPGPALHGALNHNFSESHRRWALAGEGEGDDGARRVVLEQSPWRKAARLSAQGGFGACSAVRLRRRLLRLAELCPELRYAFQAGAGRASALQFRPLQVFARYPTVGPRTFHKIYEARDTKHASL